MSRPQRGVALITAILVVAIATIASVAMATSLQIAVHRARTLQETELAWWYSEGVEQWVLTLLQRDAEISQIDSLDEPWSQPVDYLPVDEGVLRGRVEDLQGRFNLNNLAAPDPEQSARYLAHFQRLLLQLEVGTDFEVAALAAVIRDWVDDDIEPTGFDGAEDNYYLGLSPPYRTANRPMVDASEIMAVKGMTREIYALIRPFVTALPASGTPINVNTALEPVLLSLAENPSPELQAFIESRLEVPLEDTAMLQGSFSVETPPVSVATSFFRLESESLIGSSRVGLYHLVFRPDGGAPPIVLARGAHPD
jgi:general secretion pathway protein K